MAARPRHSSFRDQLVFQEDDERFFVSVSLTRSNCFVLVKSESKMSSEVWYLRADKDRSHLSVVLPRRDEVEYDVDHAIHPQDGDVWLVRVNRGPDGEKLDNFAVFQLPVGRNDPAALRPFLPTAPLSRSSPSTLSLDMLWSSSARTVWSS